MRDPLEARLAEALTAAQHRWRTRRGTWGAIVTPAVPTALIDALAAELVPVFRMAAAEVEKRPVS